MTIKYSSTSQFGRAFLLRKRNDIDLYIEDETGIALFDKYFSRLMTGFCKIENVYPLNGKQFVIEKARQRRISSDRTEIYLIDGDLAIIANDDIIDEYNLIQLNCYCVENLLACKHALQLVAKDHLCTEDIDVHPIFSFLRESLIELYSVYFANYKLNGGETTTKCSILRFYHNSSDLEQCKSEILKRKESLYSSLVSKYGNEEVDVHLDLARSFLMSKDNWYNYVSGKTVIIPIIRQILREKSRYRSDDECLKMLLANYCDLNGKLKSEIMEKISCQKKAHDA